MMSVPAVHFPAAPPSPNRGVGLRGLFPYIHSARGLPIEFFFKGLSLEPKNLPIPGPARDDVKRCGSWFILLQCIFPLYKKCRNRVVGIPALMLSRISLLPGGSRLGRFRGFQGVRTQKGERFNV